MHLNSPVHKHSYNKVELLSHRKNIHPGTIRTCKFFLLGKCDFPDSVYAGLGNTSAPQSLKEYKCGFCDQIFQNKSDFMNYRKRHHIEFTSPCRDYIIGCCRYKQGCLYKHEGLNEVSNIESSDMIRFFKIMEKFTERMKQVENHLYN